VPAAAPHILAGVTTILSDLDAGSDGAVNRRVIQVEHVSGLIVAIYFFVTTRLLGRETSGKEYVVQRKRLLDCLASLRGDEELLEKVSRKGSGKIDEDWAGWTEETTKDIDAWLLRISKSTWLQMDWFENIVEGSGVDGKQSSSNAVDDSEGEDGPIEDDSAVKAGLGTMVQDKDDYLSEKRRHEYKRWKDGIMVRIEAMESENIQTNVDTIMEEL